MHVLVVGPAACAGGARSKRVICHGVAGIADTCSGVGYSGHTFRSDGLRTGALAHHGAGEPPCAVPRSTAPSSRSLLREWLASRGRSNLEVSAAASEGQRRSNCNLLHDTTSLGYRSGSYGQRITRDEPCKDRCEAGKPPSMHVATQCTGNVLSAPTDV
jgi:hypothetical protein